MKRVAAVFLANAGLSSASSGSAVSHIVRTLKDMKAALESDAKSDKSASDKMKCYCEKSVPELETAIKKNTVLLEQNEAEAERAFAAATKLDNEIKNLNKEIASQKDQLDKAIALRNKERDEFNEKHAYLSAAIDSTKRAVEVLSKHNNAKDSSFLQSLKPELKHVAETLKIGFDRLQSLTSSSANSRMLSLSDNERTAVNAFVQGPTFGAYESASGAVFGIIQQMQEDFELDANQAGEAEATAQAAHDEARSLLEESIKSKTAQAKHKTVKMKQEQASGEKATEIAADAAKMVEEDKATLGATVQSCKDNMNEYAERVKSRSSEIEGVNKAIEYLDSDEARALFGGMKSLDFLQVSIESTNAGRAMQAAKILRTTAQHTKNAEIMVLAQTLATTKTSASVFNKIVTAIDELVAELLESKANIEADTQSCTDAINAGTQKLEEKTLAVKRLTELEGQLEKQIESLTAEIANRDEEMANTAEFLNNQALAREDANASFNKSYADNEQAGKLLKSAITEMRRVYEREAFVQAEPARAGVEKDKETWAAYEKNSKGGAVVTLLEDLLEKTEEAAKQDVETENAAQADYVNVVNTGNKQIAGANKEKTDLMATRAKTEERLVTTTQDLAKETEEQAVTDKGLAERKKGCDWVLKNGETKVANILDEVKALGNAKQILAAKTTKVGGQ